MAKKNKRKRVKEALSTSRHAEEEITSLWDNVREKPWHYGIGVGIILAALIFTAAYQHYNRASNQTLYTAYAKALEVEEPTEQAKELETTADSVAPAPEVLYMMGESAIKAGEYEKAKSTLERLRQEYPDYKFLASAVEALGFIAEQNENYEAALKAYNEVSEKWPQSFAARRQPLNIARVYETQGDLAAAVEAYEDQVQQFPDYSASQEAEAALARLRGSHPELFPEEEPAESETVPTEESAEAEESSEEAGSPSGAPEEPVTEEEKEESAQEEDVSAEKAPEVQESPEEAEASSAATGGEAKKELPDVSATPDLTIPDTSSTEEEVPGEESTPAEPLSLQIAPPEDKAADSGQ